MALVIGLTITPIAALPSGGTSSSSSGGFHLLDYNPNPITAGSFYNLMQPQNFYNLYNTNSFWNLFDSQSFYNLYQSDAFYNLVNSNNSTNLYDVNTFFNLYHSNVFFNLYNQQAFYNLFNTNGFFNLYNASSFYNLFQVNNFFNLYQSNSFYNLAFYNLFNKEAFYNLFNTTAFYNLYDQQAFYNLFQNDGFFNLFTQEVFFSLAFYNLMYSNQYGSNAFYNLIQSDSFFNLVFYNLVFFNLAFFNLYDMNAFFNLYGQQAFYNLFFFNLGFFNLSFFNLAMSSSVQSDAFFNLYFFNLEFMNLMFFNLSFFNLYQSNSFFNLKYIQNVFFNLMFYNLNYGTNPFYNLPFYNLPFYNLPFFNLPFFNLPFWNLPFFNLPFFNLPFFSLPFWNLYFFNLHFFNLHFFNLFEGNQFFNLHFFNLKVSQNNKGWELFNYGRALSTFVQLIDHIDPELPWNINRVYNNNYLGGSVSTPINIAILDTGVASHPDLTNVVWSIDTTGTGATDTSGHGTHITGIVGAARNGFGVAGVYPNARIYSIKVIDSKTGEGQWPWLQTAIYKAVAGPDGVVGTADDANVINMSFGSGTEVPPQYIHDAIQWAYNHGVVMVASGGNSGDGNTQTNEINYPAAYPEVIAVGATTFTDSLASFSSSGPYIELTAPGDYILSTYLNNSYAYWGGTSMSAPHVTGLVAMIIAEYGHLPVGNFNDYGTSTIRGILHMMAQDYGAPGWDPGYGWGIANFNAYATAPLIFHHH